MTFFASTRRYFAPIAAVTVSAFISLALSSCGNPMSAAKYHYKDPTSGEPAPVRPSSGLKEDSFRLINVEFEEPKIHLNMKDNSVEFSVLLVKNGSKVWHKLNGKWDQNFNAYLDEGITALTDTYTRAYFSCLNRLRIPGQECSEIFIDFYFTLNQKVYKYQFIAINDQIAFTDNTDNDSKKEESAKGENPSAQPTGSPKVAPASNTEQKTKSPPGTTLDKPDKAKAKSIKPTAAQQKVTSNTPGSTETSSDDIELEAINGEFKGPVLPSDFFAPFVQFLKRQFESSETEPGSSGTPAEPRAQNPQKNQAKPEAQDLKPTALQTPPKAQGAAANSNNKKLLKGAALVVMEPTPVRLPDTPTRDTRAQGQEPIEHVGSQHPYIAEIRDPIYEMNIIMDFETGGKARFGTGTEKKRNRRGQIIKVQNGDISPEGVALEKISRTANFERYSDDDKSFSTGYMKRLVEKTSLIFSAKNPNCGAFEFGNLSAQKGGPLKFDKPIYLKASGVWKTHHASHQNGLEVDMRYLLRASNKSINSRSNDSLSCNYDYVKYLAGLKFPDREYAIHSIFMSSGNISKLKKWQSLQKLNAPEDKRAIEILVPEEGHSDHMHIRSSCPPTHEKCFEET